MGGTTSKDISVREDIKKSTLSPEPITPPHLDATLPREKLPVDLQKIVDEDDTLFDQIYDGKCVSPCLIPRRHFS